MPSVGTSLSAENRDLTGNRVASLKKLAHLEPVTSHTGSVPRMIDRYRIKILSE